jgi:hypothetical protein
MTEGLTWAQGKNLLADEGDDLSGSLRHPARGALLKDSYQILGSLASI